MDSELPSSPNPSSSPVVQTRITCGTPTYQLSDGILHSEGARPNIVHSQDDDAVNHERDCLSLNVSEFYSFVENLEVVQIYAKEWEAVPHFMPQICGVNSEFYFCCPFSSSNHQPKAHDHPSQFLVPPGMPFSIHYSSVYGRVYCTPFFSVIDVCQAHFPSAIFSLSKLTLSRVVNSHIFRHELAFNSELLIEPPPKSLAACSPGELWMGLKMEIMDLMKSHRAPASFSMLAQFLTGVKHMMLSITPADLSPHIRELFDPSRLFALENTSSTANSLAETIDFTGYILETIMLPMRRNRMTKLQECFANSHENVSKLVVGLQMAVELLNLTKIDHINSQIRERISLLRCNTGIFERNFYKAQLRLGEIDRSDFSKWLRMQPRIEDLICNEATIEPLQFSQEEILNRLTAGFIYSFLRARCQTSSSKLFKQDTRRIQTIQKRLESITRSELEQSIGAMQNSSRKKLCESPYLNASKVYEVVENRVVMTIAAKVYENLAASFLSKPLLKSSSFTTFGLGLKDLENALTLVPELTIILSLHWIGAGEYYESP